PAVMVGRLSREKDIETLIRAAAIVVQRDPSFQLEIIGSGPCDNQLHRLTSDTGMNRHIRFVGESKNIPGVLANASLFILPSLTEGMSLTLLEAMAKGLPII